MTDPTSRLLKRTRRRLFVVTLGLVALLVVGIGLASAVVTLRALDAAVDQSLIASVDAATASLHDGLPSGGEDPGDSEDGSLASSDTFLLVLDPSGAVVANPSRVNLPGLPNAAAVESASASTDGRDIRTVDVGPFDVRLLTVRVDGEESDGAATGFVQGGFRLTLHDQQSASIVAAVTLVGVIGLVGAAFVTLVVTGRALIPIRRSFEAQRRFVADASHELRTPAALIRANADVMDREGLVTPAGRPLVGDIITEADRLARLVSDLLQLAATETTAFVIEPKPVDLAAIASDTVHQTVRLGAERGVLVAMAPSTGGPTIVNGDRDRIIQLVLILLDNAFDHSPSGGRVSVDVRRAGTTAQLVVTDQGPGVPAADRERVFEPFTRLPGVQRDRAGGTGLGLAIARRIVTAHQGTITVVDAAGGGAAFVVTLPSTDAAAPSP